MGEAADPLVSRAPLSGLRIVAIDNDPRILEGMRALLAGWGCDIIAAESLSAARLALTYADGAPDGAAGTG